MRPEPLVGLLDATAEACQITTDTTAWSAAECDLVLRGLGTVAYEVVGLSARIRAAKVNDTKPVHPVKPLNPPPPPPPTEDPPPPPPPQDRL